MNKEEIRIEDYLPLVKNIVGRMQVKLPAYLEIEDLISYGVFGLLEAVKRFDPTRNIKFETFATHRIRGAVLDAIRKINWAPRSVYDQIKEYNKVLDRLNQEQDGEVSEELIAKELNISLTELQKFLADINYLTIDSLDNLLFGKNDEDNYTLDKILMDRKSPDPEEEYEQKVVNRLLKNALANLNEKDQLLLNLYYYEELTLKEIGEILEVSESRVCQLHSRAILRLKKELGKMGIG